MNTADSIVVCVIAALAAAALAAILIRRKNSKGCSCGCEGCASPCRKKQRLKRTSVDQ